MKELDLPTAARALCTGYFDLLRRGIDGALVLSADRWRLETVTEEEMRFVALAPEAPPLHLVLSDVEQATWDRLPKQQVRSQIRFRLRSGDLWTFSGTIDEAVLPD